RQGLPSRTASRGPGLTALCDARSWSTRRPQSLLGLPGASLACLVDHGSKQRELENLRDRREDDLEFQLVSKVVLVAIHDVRHEHEPVLLDQLDGSDGVGNPIS